MGLFCKGRVKKFLVFSLCLRLPPWCLVVPKGDFDVRWLRGSASDLIFAPWLRAIERDGGKVIGGKRVSTIRFKGLPVAESTLGTVAGVAKVASSGGEGNEGDEKGGGGQGAGNGEALRKADGGGAVDDDPDAEGDDCSMWVETTDGEVFTPDAVVLAVGITAAKVRPHAVGSLLQK